jgi:low affinity Fe/Cu permease
MIIKFGALMRRVHQYIDVKFDKITTNIMLVLGNSITFIIAMVLVFFWLTGNQFVNQTLHQKIENIIVAVTFLTLFTIQKEFKRFSSSLHIKLNELISSNITANNKIMVVEEKTESELLVLTKMYAESASNETDSIPIELEEKDKLK